MPACKSRIASRACGHRFLNRMQHAVVGKIFDRDQFGAIELTE